MRKGTDKDWEQRAGCMTFPEAVSKAVGVTSQWCGWGVVSHFAFEAPVQVLKSKIQTPPIQTTKVPSQQ